MAAVALLPRQRDLLVKVLGMTGSPHQGEVVAAVAAAHRILTAAGVSWDSVIVSAPDDADPAPPDEARDDDEDTADADIEWCLEHGGAVLTSWDRDFLVSLQRFVRLSDKQRAVLDRIIGKCRRAQPR